MDIFKYYSTDSCTKSFRNSQRDSFRNCSRALNKFSAWNALRIYSLNSFQYCYMDSFKNVQKKKNLLERLLQIHLDFFQNMYYGLDICRNCFGISIRITSRGSSINFSKNFSRVSMGFLINSSNIFFRILYGNTSRKSYSDFFSENDSFRNFSIDSFRISSRVY